MTHYRRQHAAAFASLPPRTQLETAANAYLAELQKQAASAHCNAVLAADTKAMINAIRWIAELNNLDVQ